MPFILFLTGFILRRGYVVPIMMVLTGLSCQGVCGAYNVGSDWFYLSREYVVPIMLVLTGFILPDSMRCLLCWF